MRWTEAIVAMALFIAAPASAQPGNDPLAALEPATVTVTARSFAPASPDIYGTVALDAEVTVYGARWRRVSAADQSDPRVLALAAASVAAAADPLARLATVHALVSRRVRWRSDLDAYHVADYWAQAGETLTRGEGDSEDIAILKMEILKAAGFAPRDIYLSVGRDRRRGADTLLLVRIGRDFYALDDRSPRPIVALSRSQFDPIITLGRDSAWLHGHRVAEGSGSPHVVRAALGLSTVRR